MTGRREDGDKKTDGRYLGITARDSVGIRALHVLGKVLIDRRQRSR